MRATVFDELENIFDKTELSVEDKVVYSQELKTLLLEEIRKEIGKLPIGKLISDIMEKEVQRQTEKNTILKTFFDTELGKTKVDAKNEVGKLNAEIHEFMDKMRKKYDGLKNEIMTINGQQWHQFGGFSPQFNDLNIGDPSVEGAWRIVKSGNNLSVQRLESDIWTEKGNFQP